MSDSVRGAQPKGPFPWLLWWMVDPRTLRKQVSQYKTLPLHETSRGQSALLLGLSAAISVAVILLSSHNPVGLADVAIFLVLAAFVYLGHRWAMIAAMIVWTLEKGVQIAAAIYAHQYVIPFTALIWWTIYMHVFYFAFRVETARRETPDVTAATFD
jgi:hypothetical protein